MGESLMVEAEPTDKMFSLLLTRGQHERLAAEAQRQDRSMGWVLRAALEEYLERRADGEG